MSENFNRIIPRYCKFLLVLILAVVLSVGIACGTSSVNVVRTGIERGEALVQANPDNPDLRIALGDLYLSDGQYYQAIDQYNETLRLVNNHEGALLGLGVAYKSLGQEGVAIDYFNKVVAIGKDSEMAKMNQKLQGAYYYLGEVYLKRGERDQAIEQLKNSIALNPADADALYLLGRAYQDGNAYEEATTYYSQAIAYVPNFLEVYEGMRQCYQKLGNKPLAAYAQGMLALFSGEYQEALQQLEVALAAESDIANAFWGLGYAYERTGQVRQAKDAYEKALGVDPNHILAKSAISRLDRVFPNSG